MSSTLGNGVNPASLTAVVGNNTVPYDDFRYQRMVSVPAPPVSKYSISNDITILDTSFRQVLKNLEEINKILKIIMADPVLLNQNASLRDAYDHYEAAKLIEPRYNSSEFYEAYNAYLLLEAIIKESK